MTVRPTEIITTTFMMSGSHEPSDITEWSSSWSDLSLAEYVKQKREASSGSETEATPRQKSQSPQPRYEEVHIKAHSKCMLPDGRLSLLVDLGSQVNVIGCETEKDFIAKAGGANMPYTHEDRRERLHINGVGSDAAICDQTTTLPIAVKFQEQQATKETFKANVAKGCGAHLPAILGSKSMQDKDSVIVLRKGLEMIAFPGPGGYKIEWSPGTKLLPMVPAPSGHLVIPCDRFEEFSTNNTPSENITFWTDHSQDLE